MNQTPHPGSGPDSPAAPGELPPARADQPRPRRKPLSFGQFAGLTAELRTAVVNIAILLVLVALVPLLVQQILRKEVLIEPISVPPVLAEQGLTPEVAAKRLWDGLSAVTREANSSRKSVQAMPDSEIVSFSIPDAGVSFDSLIYYLRKAFNIYPIRIGGELSCADPACRPEGQSLRLRVMRATPTLIELPARGEASERDYLFRAAAEVMAVVDPFIASAALASSQPARAEHMARTLVLAGGADAPWAHNLVGNLLSDRADYAGAEAEYRAALAQAPGLLPARKNLANVLRLKGDLVVARKEFGALVSIYPNDGYALMGLGEIAMAENRPDEALGWFTRAARASPLLTRPVLRAADIEAGRNNSAAAEALWKKALDIDPGDAIALLLYSLRLDTAERRDEALALFARAADTYPDAAEWQSQYAERLRQAGRLDEALARADTAVALAPEAGNFRLTRAYVRRDRADIAGALADAIKAETLDARLSGAVFLEGSLLSSLGRNQEAAAAYRRFAALAPDDPFSAVVPQLIERLEAAEPPAATVD